MNLRCPALLAGVLLLGVAPLAGQAIQGRLVQEGSDTPVSDAVVILMDSAGIEVDRAITFGSGGFSLAARGAGRYQLRILRIGFRAWTSDRFPLSAGPPVRRVLSLAGERIALPELTVAARAFCTNNLDDQPVLLTVLDEARKALAATELTLRNRQRLYKVRRYVRRLDLHLRSTEERLVEGWGRGAWPVRSVGAEALERLGFVADTGGPDGPVYFGPDAAVLFSDFFMGSHCFHLEIPDDSITGRVGLGFRPVKPRRNKPDISGVLWVDTRTLLLQTLEFRYTGLPRWASTGASGGELSFRPLGGGGFIVGAWWLRAPVPVMHQDGRTTLSGYMMIGGEVEDVRIDPAGS